MPIKLSLLYRSHPRTSPSGKVGYRWRHMIVSVRIPKVTGMSPGFVAHIVSINPMNSLCKSRQQLQYYWNARTRNKLLLWKQLLHFLAPLTPAILSHLFSGLSVCCFSLFRPKLQQKAATVCWNTYILQCQSGMTWRLTTFLSNLFHLPFPSSFNKAILLLQLSFHNRSYKVYVSLHEASLYGQ